MKFRLPQRLTRMTTDPAVRVGVLHAAASIGPSFSRGLLPRSQTQQAILIGVNGALYYAIGTTGWSGMSSINAGLPGRRAGWRARLVGAAVFGTAGAVGEKLLRPRSGDNLAMGAAWSTARFLGSVGLAGGIVTASDVIVHERIGRNPSAATTLAIDVAGGIAMAAGSFIRRDLRARKFEHDFQARPAITPPKTPKNLPAPKRVIRQVTSSAKVLGVAAGTVTGFGMLALAEQTIVRILTGAGARFVGRDLGEIGELVAHIMTASAGGFAGVWALNNVRNRVQRKDDVTEPAYPAPPTNPNVSSGPRSSVKFDEIGKEGRRFVLMALRGADIEGVMKEDAEDPVRIVIGKEGSIEERVDLTISELTDLGAFDKSMIVIAAPTGVGYVNYVMAEALEYLTRGSCAIVVPQYALLPSALALNTTDLGTELQAKILEAVSDRITQLPEAQRPRLVQFGESLGAQVALDVAAEGGVARLDHLNVEAGLYMGVPFRSKVWRSWREHPRALDPNGRIENVPMPSMAPRKAGMHLMVIHYDDPVNKFGYAMVAQRPWYFGPPETRPPKMPKETLFRPLTSFVIALIDLLNGMNAKPGEFRRVGHDYRIDIREALQKTYLLHASDEQAATIEDMLREREQQWAEKRLVYKAFDTAARQVTSTLSRWGRGNQPLDLPQQDLPEGLKGFSKLIAKDSGTG